MKRKLTITRNQLPYIIDKKLRLCSEREITPEFISECESDFKENPSNIIAKNAINSVGLHFATIDSDVANSITHVFLHSLKKKDLRATNQGASGRCWMFAGLNMFSHMIIKALKLENFEFSETYLFFW